MATEQERRIGNMVRLQECDDCRVAWPPEKLVSDGTPEGGETCPDCAAKRFGAAFVADPPSAIREPQVEDPDALDVPVPHHVYEAIRRRRANGPVRINLCDENGGWCNAEIAWTDQGPVREPEEERMLDVPISVRAADLISRARRDDRRTTVRLFRDGASENHDPVATFPVI
jgi:hypothetical protein